MKIDRSKTMDQISLSMRPTVRQLEYAIAVESTRHFGRAAAACSVTQPALSAQLLQLESSLGVTLFERSRRGVIPTPEGERLLPLARATLRALDDLVHAAGEAKDPLSGDLRLGVIPTVAPYLLPHALPELRKRFPKLRCLLVEDKTDAIVERLCAGRIDLGVLARPAGGDDLQEVPLFDEPFVATMRSDHPLAKRRRLKIDDLAASDVLLLEDGHCLRAQALAVCARGGSAEVEG